MRDHEIKGRRVDIKKAIARDDMGRGDNRGGGGGDRRNDRGGRGGRDRDNRGGGGDYRSNLNEFMYILLKSCINFLLFLCRWAEKFRRWRRRWRME